MRAEHSKRGTNLASSDSTGLRRLERPDLGRCPDSGRTSDGPPPAAARCAHVCGEYIREYMPTSVHIPPELLKAVDKRAKALGVSRNSLIVNALERDLGMQVGWPPGFFESLAVVDDELRATLDDTMAEVKAQRRSKRPVAL